MQIHSYDIKRADFKEKLSILVKISNVVDGIDKKIKEIISSIEADIVKENTTVISNKEMILKNALFVKDEEDSIKKLLFDLKVIAKILDKEEDIKDFVTQIDSYVITLHITFTTYMDVDKIQFREAKGTLSILNSAI